MGINKKATAMGINTKTSGAPPLPGTTHIMQFTAPNIVFKFHTLYCTLLLIANQCNCSWIGSLLFLLFLGSPPATSSGAASSICHLSRGKTPLSIQCSFQSLLPYKILGVISKALPAPHFSSWSHPNQKSPLPEPLRSICTFIFHLPCDRDTLGASSCTSPPVQSSTSTDTLHLHMLSPDNTCSCLAALGLPS